MKKKLIVVAFFANCAPSLSHFRPRSYLHDSQDHSLTRGLPEAKSDAVRMIGYLNAIQHSCSETSGSSELKGLGSLGTIEVEESLRS